MSDLSAGTYAVTHCRRTRAMPCIDVLAAGVYRFGLAVKSNRSLCDFTKQRVQLSETATGWLLFDDDVKETRFAVFVRRPTSANATRRGLEPGVYVIDPFSGGIDRKIHQMCERRKALFHKLAEDELQAEQERIAQDE